jgi:hypothetical protein
VNFPLKGSAIEFCFLEVNRQFVSIEVVSLKLARYNFDREERDGAFKNNHEDSPAEVEDVEPVEDILLKDVAEVGAEEPNVNTFLIDGDILGDSIGVMKEHDIKEGVVETTVEVLSVDIQMQPCLKDQIFHLVVEFIIILL